MSEVFTGTFNPPSMDGMKPLGVTSDEPRMHGKPEHDARVVQLPPVQSFGRLQEDKWLLLKTLEESAELVEAGKQYLKQDLSPDRVMLREAMLSEWADVLQTLANTATAFGFTDTEIKLAMAQCLERNRRKGRV